MQITRIAALLGAAAALSVATACAIEPDPEAIEACKPGELQCLSDDQLRTCGEEGLWAAPDPFICAFGSCMIMDGVPVCM